MDNPLVAEDPTSTRDSWQRIQKAVRVAAAREQLTPDDILRIDGMVELWESKARAITHLKQYAIDLIEKRYGQQVVSPTKGFVLDDITGVSVNYSEADINMLKDHAHRLFGDNFVPVDSEHAEPEHPLDVAGRELDEFTSRREEWFGILDRFKVGGTENQEAFRTLAQKLSSMAWLGDPLADLLFFIKNNETAAYLEAEYPELPKWMAMDIWERYHLNRNRESDIAYQRRMNSEKRVFCPNCMRNMEQRVPAGADTYSVWVHSDSGSPNCSDNGSIRREDPEHVSLGLDGITEKSTVAETQLYKEVWDLVTQLTPTARSLGELTNLTSRYSQAKDLDRKYPGVVHHICVTLWTRSGK